MKNIHRTAIFGWLAVIALFLFSCTKEEGMPEGSSVEGAPLRLTVSFEQMTRLAELPGPSGIVDDKGYGLKNIGLYIYYTEDYKNEKVTEPYIRNLECTVNNEGVLVPVLKEGDDPVASDIFIYDRMTIVAFYPYNPDAEDFKTIADEEKYPITRSDYSTQYYIPYRAQTTTNPTVAFLTELHFFPKHTYKLEVVLVSDEDGAIPDGSMIEMLPNIDPVDNDPADGKRAKWYDSAVIKPNVEGGSNVGQYVAYIWTRDERPNDIPRGEVLLSFDGLTLIASQDISVTEQYVYRYGYNLSTGEIFIPTSSNLVHDRPSLESVHNLNEGTAYQVCDIDISGNSDWSPMRMYSSRFDGGGHAITGLTINNSGPNAGLFGAVQGGLVVCNVNLIEPSITVNAADTVYVGSVCARLNPPLSDEDKAELIGNLPDELSEVVKQALIEDLLASALNSQSNLVACRVVEPQIQVTGIAPRVGALCGTSGDGNSEASFKAKIWDSYVLGGSISVNAGSEADNAGGYTGGFVGLNNGTIDYSYTTMENIIFQQEQSDGTLLPDETGFTTTGTIFGSGDAGVSESFSALSDTAATRFADGWPSWGTYTSWWPKLYTGWLGSPSTDFWYSTGIDPNEHPILQWERR